MKSTNYVIANFSYMQFVDTLKFCASPIFLVDDGDGWLSLFQLYGGNRDTATSHPPITTIIIITTIKKRYSNTTSATLTTVTRPLRRIIVISSIKYRMRLVCTLVVYAVKQSATVGITLPFIGPSQIFARCAGSPSLEETT